ncbi:MAG TPA: GNAT family N-acetyltransferase [Micromonosporaceae bacterium]|nr:GNAT family N-acetyltransferase [Micromonosporaceae bacterium]
MKAIFVREATLADVDRIVDVHTQARRAYYGAGGLALEAIKNPTVRREQRAGWTDSIQSPDKRVLCAEVDGKIVGVAAMGPPLESNLDARVVGQLYQLHVVPTAWGIGIGSTLHADFVGYLMNASLSTGLLEVWARNTRAQAFYAKHGWKPDGHRRPGPDNSHYLRLRVEVAPRNVSPVL